MASVRLTSGLAGSIASASWSTCSASAGLLVAHRRFARPILGSMPLGATASALRNAASALAALPIASCTAARLV